MVSLDVQRKEVNVNCYGSILFWVQKLCSISDNSLRIMQFGRKIFTNEGAYAVLQSPNFESPSFHSFKAVEKPKVWIPTIDFGPLSMHKLALVCLEHLHLQVGEMTSKLFEGFQFHVTHACMNVCN